MPFIRRWKQAIIMTDLCCSCTAPPSCFCQDKQQNSWSSPVSMCSTIQQAMVSMRIPVVNLSLPHRAGSIPFSLQRKSSRMLLAFSLSRVTLIGMLGPSTMGFGPLDATCCPALCCISLNNNAELPPLDFVLMISGCKAIKDLMYIECGLFNDLSAATVSSNSNGSDRIV